MEKNNEKKSWKGNTGNKRGKGNLGEQYAKEYLIDAGYNIIKKNYRCRHGEIDLIAEQLNREKALVFVEVKSRATEKYGIPCQAVDTHKIRKIEGAVKNFIQNNKQYKDYEIRIDVIEIYYNRSFTQIKKLHHIENVTL